jgi:TonB family protein
MKAQKNYDLAQADLLLKSLILPHPAQWYEEIFGPTMAKNEGALYERAGASVPTTVGKSLLNAAALKPDSMYVQRFDRTCDDNAGEFTYGILHARLEPVPLYEVRFVHGNQLMRLFSFAFVGGGFRFIITPKLDGPVFPPTSSGPPSNSNVSAPPQTAEAEKRVTVGGTVQAARLIQRVQPSYPESARKEHLQGIVKLRALITKDGSVQHLYVIQGYCSLAESSIEAVKKWRYTPTMLLGRPVEVDTQINVIFSLSQ